MKWVLVVVGVVVLLVAVVILIGLALPQSHTATVARRYEAPPETVWQTITDVERFATWRADLKSAERLPDHDGHVRWKEKTKYDEMTLEVLELVPPRRMVARIADEGLPFGGSWTYELQPAENGTQLTITENGEVYNPFFRFVSRFVMGHTGTLEKYHASLGRKFASGSAAQVSRTP
jgi:uncharacterized protein YndB with AHSA1/START domain